MNRPPPQLLGTIKRITQTTTTLWRSSGCAPNITKKFTSGSVWQLMIKHPRELAYAVLVSQGDPDAWKLYLNLVKQKLYTWQDSCSAEFEIEIVEGLWAASKSYRGH